jgi:hypothetical protein
MFFVAPSLRMILRYSCWLTVVAAYLLVGVPSYTGGVVLSNMQLPQDTRGRSLITGETAVLTQNGTYYF